MITIAIANHKGGVGKTATTHALGAGLAALGRRVLLVDIDPQSSLTAAAGVEDASGKSLAEVLGGAAPGHLSLSDILLDISDQETAVLHLVPADIALSKTELDLFSEMGRENFLKNALTAVRRRYDVCLIDCPPSLGLLTVNALTAADYVLIPTQPQISDLRGLRLFLDSVAKARAKVNPGLQILGVLLTFYDDRLIHHQDAVNVLQGQKIPLFAAKIGRSVRVAEAPAAGESILTYDPENKQAAAYTQLANEVNQWLRNAAR